MFQLTETLNYISKKITYSPKIGIILGSGLGSFAKELEHTITLPYSEIPHFKQSTIEGHAGNLLFGTIHQKEVVLMQGRFHYYEGYSMQEITYPIRLMKKLGVEYLFVSNAAGGLNPNFSTGNLMVITDHINFFPEHPLRGPNLAEFGERFPDMSETYNKNLISLAQNIAAQHAIPIQTGIYIGSSGPSLETPAEYNLFRQWGADATGMSTVPEVIVAHHCGIKCFGVSVITNVSKDTIAGKITSHDHVQQEAALAEPRLGLIFKELIKTI